MLLADSDAQVRNNGDGRLNEKVGADFVQKEKLPPLGVSSPGDDGSRSAPAEQSVLYGMVKPTSV